MGTLKFGQRGMTLIGTLVSVAIAGIVLTALVSGSVYSFQSQRNVRLTSNFIDLMNEVRGAMQDGRNVNCTLNVKTAIDAYKASGKNTNFKTIDYDDTENLPEIPVTLYYYDESENPEREIVKVNSVIDELVIKESVIRPRAQISEGKVLLDIEVKAEKTGEVLGSRSLAHKISVLATIDDDGQFISCGANGTTVEEKVCSMLADGSYAYDPKSGKCVKTTAVKCFASGTGSAEYAKCPASTVPKGCSTTAHEEDYAGTTSRPYQDGKTLEARAEFYVCRKTTDAMEARCVYATDFNRPAGTICSACCEVRVLDSNGGVIQYPDTPEGVELSKGVPATNWKSFRPNAY